MSINQPCHVTKGNSPLTSENHGNLCSLRTMLFLLYPREWLRSIVMGMAVSVCVSVCLRGYLWNHTHNLHQFLCMLHMAVALFSSGRVTKSQGKWQFCFFSHSRAFGTHAKTAEPIEMPFGTMSGLGFRNSVLRGGDDPRRGRGNFGANVPNKPNTPNN